MKLIITGANGFIGKHLCKRMQTEGWDFTCLIRSKSSDIFFVNNGIPTIEMESETKSLE